MGDGGWSMVNGQILPAVHSESTIADQKYKSKEISYAFNAINIQQSKEILYAFNAFGS